MTMGVILKCKSAVIGILVEMRKTQVMFVLQMNA